MKITTIGPKEKKPRFSSQNSRAMRPSSIVISSSRPPRTRSFYPWNAQEIRARLILADRIGDTTHEFCSSTTS